MDDAKTSKRAYRRAGSAELRDRRRSPRAEVNRLTKKFGARLRPELIDRLKDEAKKRGRSQSAVLAEILDRHLP